MSDPTQAAGAATSAPATVDVASLTPEAARAEIARLGGDEGFTRQLLHPAYAAGPAHQEALSRLRALHERAHGANSQPVGSEAVMAEALTPPASPGGYTLPRDPDAPEWDAQFEQEARGHFHALGMSNGDAQFMLTAWNAAAAKGAPSDEQLTSMRQDATTQLAAKHGGPEGAERAVKAARGLIDTLPEQQRARVRELLDRSGLGSNPAVISRLALIAQRRGIGS